MEVSEMVVLELMSDGKIVKLPEDMKLQGLPSHVQVSVALLLPFNRVIVGSSINGMDLWTWGKLGDMEWRELFLYDGTDQILKEDNIPDIILNADSVDRLKSFLFEQIPAPGNHVSTVLVLRGINSGSEIPGDGHQWTDEQWFLSRISGNNIVIKAYWGIRRALFERNPEMLERIKTWYSYASDVFQEPFNYPRMWFSLTDLPGKEDTEELEGVGFTRENLKNMNSKFSNPIVLSNALGYLILLTEYTGIDRNELKIWMYINMNLWEELRRKRKLSIREVVSSGWGFLDAVDAETMMGRYGHHQNNTAEVKT